MPKTELNAGEVVQMANSYAVATGDKIRDVARLAEFLVWTSQNKDKLKSYKVAFVSVCLNPSYWEFAKDVVKSAKDFFLPGHQVDFLVWTDMPQADDEEAFVKAEQAILGQRLVQLGVPEIPKTQYDTIVSEVKASVARAKESCRAIHKETVFPTEPVEWPLPTLMRYHLYLQQEEKLKEYDYIFHCDMDMIFVDYVGDEILGEGLTAAKHPMYDLRPNFYAPFEPNPESAAYVPQHKNYYAGGFQGGKTEEWLKAMWEMKRMVDQDFNKNYIPRWNEESIFNRYLIDHPPAVTLSPAYVYPDSMIDVYYSKIWPEPYKPKLVTLTKRFSTSKQAGSATQKMLEGL